MSNRFFFFSVVFLLLSDRVVLTSHFLLLLLLRLRPLLLSPTNNNNKTMISLLPFTSRSSSTATADGGAGAPLGTSKQASTSPFARFKQKAAELTTSSSSSSPVHQLAPGAPLPHVVLPVVHVKFLGFFDGDGGRNGGRKGWVLGPPRSLSLFSSLDSSCSSHQEKDSSCFFLSSLSHFIFPFLLPTKTNRAATLSWDHQPAR